MLDSTGLFEYIGTMIIIIGFLIIVLPNIILFSLREKVALFVIVSACLNLIFLFLYGHNYMLQFWLEYLWPFLNIVLTVYVFIRYLLKSRYYKKNNSPKPQWGFRLRLVLQMIVVLVTLALLFVAFRFFQIVWILFSGI